MMLYFCMGLTHSNIKTTKNSEKSRGAFSLLFAIIEQFEGFFKEFPNKKPRLKQTEMGVLLK